MRITDPGHNYDNEKARFVKDKKIAEKRGVHGARRDMANDVNFMKELDGAVEEQLKRSLDELVDEIKEQAKTLTSHRTFDELEKYKKMVKSFMEQAVRKIYAVKVSDSSKLMSKRKKVYIIVEAVDKELEKITTQLLSGQSETLDFLASLERINGMLVDMYS
ncbi:MAG: YaaR family protein [Spirochaetia bacterium]|nr:YaaR family protein [Spirochaetia bacterium]